MFYFFPWLNSWAVFGKRYGSDESFRQTLHVLDWIPWWDSSQVTYVLCHGIMCYHHATWTTYMWCLDDLPQVTNLTPAPCWNHQSWSGLIITSLYKSLPSWTSKFFWQTWNYLFPLLPYDQYNKKYHKHQLDDEWHAKFHSLIYYYWLWPHHLTMTFQNVFLQPRGSLSVSHSWCYSMHQVSTPLLYRLKVYLLPRNLSGLQNNVSHLPWLACPERKPIV